MREQMAAQQQEIDALKVKLAGKDAQVDAATQTAADAQAQAAAAKTAAAQSESQVQSMSSSVNDLKTTTTGLSETVVASQKRMEDEINSPTTIHYKGITIQPIAFVAAEGVYRQHSVNSDVNTPFNSIPFPSANEAHTSELNFTGRQSRLGALFQGDTGRFKLTGYYEMDFLGTGTTSNNNQSNSYVMRQRQIWGRVESMSGFAMTGGQMWSLVTEDRKGTDARTEIQPQTIDSQYLVGYSWTRQPGFRIQQRFGDYKTAAFTAALSVEQAQITNFTANGTNPNQYFFGGYGQNGGLYNAAESSASGATTTTCTTATPPVCTSTTTVTTGNLTTYANNVVPDVIVKAAFDTPVLHVELGGIGRFFRDYYYPVTAVGGTYIPVTSNGTGGTPAYSYASGGPLSSNTSAGGGVFGSARVYVGKIAEIALQGMAGAGVGRYGSSQLADVTLRPNETLEPIKNYHGLFSLENHLTPKFDLSFYYGGEYAQRTVYTTAVGNLIGYATPNQSSSGCYANPAAVSTTQGAGVGGTLSASSCGEPTRYIQEAMASMTYKAINSPKYGRLQYQLTYSYIQRNQWAGVLSGTYAQPGATYLGARATEPMVHVSMRYYIP
jgi:hypothetical protein